jgi:hypothetical protein
MGRALNPLQRRVLDTFGTPWKLWIEGRLPLLFTGC